MLPVILRINFLEVSIIKETLVVYYGKLMTSRQFWLVHHPVTMNACSVQLWYFEHVSIKSSSGICFAYQASLARISLANFGRSAASLIFSLGLLIKSKRPFLSGLDGLTRSLKLSNLLRRARGLKRVRINWWTVFIIWANSSKFLVNIITNLPYGSDQSLHCLIHGIQLFSSPRFTC